MSNMRNFVAPHCSMRKREATRLASTAMRLRTFLDTVLLLCVAVGALLQVQTLLAVPELSHTPAGGAVPRRDGPSVTQHADERSEPRLPPPLPPWPPPTSLPPTPPPAAVPVYARGPPSEQCVGEHRPGQLEEFRSKLTSYCGGRIRCVSRRLDYAETFCEADGMSVNMTLFRQFLQQRPVRPSSNIDEYYLEEAPSGTFYADCDFNAGWELFNWGGARTLRKSFVRSAEQPGCVAYPEPTVMLTRLYGKNNLWHASEDVMHLHESRILFGWEHARLVVLDAPSNLTSRELVRPYHPLYEHVFAPGLGYWSAHELFANVTAPCVTFAKTFWQVHGGASAFQRSVGHTPGCRNSPLMTSLADAVLRTLPPVALVPGRTLGVVRGNHTIRKVVSPPWDAYVASRASSRNHSFVDFATLDILEQIQLVRSAQTLIGIHGAALTHGLWMQPGSRVVEVAQGFRCFCYSNVAYWAGIDYLEVPEEALERMALEGTAGL